MTTRPVPPARPPRPSAADLARRPSFRWRLRRWVLQKLDAWPKAEPWEPGTEWGRMRRAERIELVGEVERLRALEDRLSRENVARALWSLFIEDCVERAGQDDMPPYSTYSDGDGREPCEWREQSEDLRQWCRDRAGLLLRQAAVVSVADSDAAAAAELATDR